ncbi:MAG: AMP-binding protein [Oscillospiraceae bacterium]|nr:AMP-binding protein [Oscillospiraceae bacterium]
MDKNNVKTLYDLVKNSAACYGERVFLKEKNGKDIVEKDHNEFYEDVLKVCGFVASKSEGRTVHAAVIGPTSYAYLTAYFGTVSGGNVIVPLDAQLSCTDICELLQRADVEIFFYDKRYEPMLDQIRISCPAIHTYVPLQELSETVSAFEAKEPESISPDRLAAIVYTSGTTGKSKGVMLSHGNLIDNAMCMDNESTEEDSLLTVLPIHHVYCLTCDILLSLRYGCCICVNDSMLRIGQNLKLFQPTTMLLVPMIAETIYKQIKTAASAKPDVPIKAIADAVFGGKLKVIYSGGAYLRPELAQAYMELGIPISQGYGMTECSPRISTGDLNGSTLGDVGIIVKGCQVKIVDGEITAKSPSVMMGYYKDEAATAEAIDSEGWLHTGDLGYVEDNRIYITGRKKNLIILSNGENVSPEELENKFAGVEFIAEVLVYADDSVITAEIFPSPDYCKDMTNEQVADMFRELVNNINKTVTSSKTIRRLRMRNVEFDKTTSKKIRRNQEIQGDLI